jgi:hypothetical protein
MQSYNAKLYPEPEKRDSLKMKEFFNLKYKQRRFAQQEQSSSEEDEDSDTEKKKKKKKKAKKRASSSEQEEEEVKKEVKGKGKLMAPPSIGSGKIAKKAEATAPQVMNFLEMDT